MIGCDLKVSLRDDCKTSSHVLVRPMKDILSKQNFLEATSKNLNRSYPNLDTFLAYFYCQQVAEQAKRELILLTPEFVFY